MREIIGFARGVDDEAQHLAVFRRHQIVDDAAAIVGEDGVAHAAGTQADNIGGHEPLEFGGDIGAGEHDLPHMRDVEERGLGAGMKVLGDDARRILHGHVITGESRELRAEALMQRIKRGARELFFRHRIARALQRFEIEPTLTLRGGPDQTTSFRLQNNAR